MNQSRTRAHLIEFLLVIAIIAVVAIVVSTILGAPM